MHMQSSAGEDTSTPSARRASWMAFCAFGWAMLFAALSFFWAAGGRTGLQPLEQAPGVPRTLWVIINVAAGLLKVGGGLLALALVRTSRRPSLHRLLLIAAWIGGIGFCVYGGLGLISDVLHVTGIINAPATRHWFFWYLVLWDPYWMLGGLLYIMTAWQTMRT